MKKVQRAFRAEKIKPSRPLLSGKLILAVCAFAIVGLVTLLATHAATPVNNAFEPDDGSITGNITKAPDTNASAGNYVSFNAPPVETCPAGTSGTPPNCVTIPTGGTVTLPNPGSWTNLTGNLSSVNNCDAWSRLFTPPSGSKVYVSMSCNHSDCTLYAGTGTSNWTKQGTGSGSASPDIMASQILFDPNNVNNMWLSGIYCSGDTFASTDGGTTFKSLNSAPNGHSDGIGVDLTDPSHKTLVEGQHESRPLPQVFRSTNSGQSWTGIASNLPDTLEFTENPYVVNSTTYVMAAFVSWYSNFGAQPGIYRTTNSGASWTKQADYYTNGYPFVSGGILYYTSAANGSDGVVRSTDNGVTWAHVGSGIKAETQVIGLPDGKLVALSGTENKLISSSDHGSTWKSFGATIPCSAASVAYSPGQDAFFAAAGDCGSSVYKLK